MHLNTIAGRTYNDLSQYPVVSIIVSTFYSDNSFHLDHRCHSADAAAGYT